MAAVIMLNVDIPCSECSDRVDDSQPNHCRQCGGAGSIRKLISHAELRYLPVIPEVRSAIVVFSGGPGKHKPRKKREGGRR